MRDITLALGGGGIRGIAHFGIIKKLINSGYNIKAIAGTSIGGIVGAICALDHDIDEIIDDINDLDQRKIYSHIIDKTPSLLGINGLIDLLHPYLGEKTFDDLKIPFACTAVDLVNTKEIIIKNGRLIEGVLATSAFPGIFPPKEIKGRKLVDGGVMDPVPVALARYLDPLAPVVAVCLSQTTQDHANQPEYHIPAPTPIPIPSIIVEQFSKLRIAQAVNIFAQSMEITSDMLAELRLKVDKPDILIRPALDNVAIFDMVNPRDLVQIGEQAASEIINKLEKQYNFINRLSRLGYLPEPPGELLK